jgi:hypothetical protein
MACTRGEQTESLAASVKMQDPSEIEVLNEHGGDEHGISSLQSKQELDANPRSSPTSVCKHQNIVMA